jgi:hypothetical protein
MRLKTLRRSSWSPAMLCGAAIATASSAVDKSRNGLSGPRSMRPPSTIRWTASARQNAVARLRFRDNVAPDFFLGSSKERRRAGPGRLTGSGQPALERARPRCFSPSAVPFRWRPATSPAIDRRGRPRLVHRLPQAPHGRRDRLSDQQPDPGRRTMGSGRPRAASRARMVLRDRRSFRAPGRWRALGIASSAPPPRRRRPASRRRLWRRHDPGSPLDRRTPRSLEVPTVAPQSDLQKVPPTTPRGETIINAVQVNRISGIL